MDKEAFIVLDENSEKKTLNKGKKLMLNISSGLLLLIFLFILIAMPIRNKAKKEIIIENIANNEIIEENENPEDLIEENGYYYHLDKDTNGSKVLRFYKASKKLLL